MELPTGGGRRFFDRPEADVRRSEAWAACKVLAARPKFFPYAHERLVADEATSDGIIRALVDQFGDRA